MGSQLTAYIPLEPDLRAEFRIRRPGGEIIVTKLQGRVIEAYHEVVVKRGIPVLQFVVETPDQRIDAVIADDEGGWWFDDEPVTLLDAAPWLEG